MSTASLVAARLESAIGTGEIIGIVYHGGSQPGAQRDILPLQVTGDTVRAKCLSTGTAKTFVLAKIELRPVVQSPDATDPQYRPGYIAPERFNDLASIHNAIRPELEAAGWTVRLEAGPDNEALVAFGRFKNGNLRKSASAGITYQKYTWDTVATLEGDLERQNIRPRQRPWSVFCKTLDNAHTFATADKAVELLLSRIRGISSVG